MNSKQINQVMQQFNQYKHKNIEQKQILKKQIEKCRAHLTSFTSKLQKKYSNKLSQQRTTYQRKIEKMQRTYKNNLQQVQNHLNEKNNIIKELGTTVHKLQLEKRKIIEMNTGILKQLAKQYQNEQQIKNNPQSTSYKQLIKMYQYLIEQNNQIKKQLFIKQHENDFKIEHQKSTSKKIHNESIMSKGEKSFSKNQKKLKSTKKVK